MTTNETIPAVDSPVCADRAAFVAPRKELLAALQAVAKAIPRRTLRSDLACITIGVNGTVDLSATDLEITSRLVDQSWDRSGDAVARFLPGRAIACLTASKASDATLAIDRSAGIVRVECGGSSVDIPLDAEQPTEHLPMPAAGELLFSIDAAELRRAVELTEFATDRESARYALGGIQFEPGDTGRVTFVATDSRRLSVYHAAGDVAAESFGFDYFDDSPQPGVVLPTKFWLCLVRALPKTGRVEFSRRNIGKNTTEYTAICGGVRVDTLPVEGRFPQYRGVIPAATEFSLTVRAAELGEAVKAAKTGTSDDCRGIDFRFAPGSSILTAEGKSGESVSRSQCPIMATGGVLPEGDFLVTIDGGFMADVCKPWRREYLEIHFHRIDGKPVDETPVTIRQGNFLHAVMPLARA